MEPLSAQCFTCFNRTLHNPCAIVSLITMVALLAVAAIAIGGVAYSGTGLNALSKAGGIAFLTGGGCFVVCEIVLIYLSTRKASAQPMVATTTITFSQLKTVIKTYLSNPGDNFAQMYAQIQVFQQGNPMFMQAHETQFTAMLIALSNFEQDVPKISIYQQTLLSNQLTLEQRKENIKGLVTALQNQLDSMNRMVADLDKM